MLGPLFATQALKKTPTLAFSMNVAKILRTAILWNPSSGCFYLLVNKATLSKEVLGYKLLGLFYKLGNSGN